MEKLFVLFLLVAIAAARGVPGGDQAEFVEAVEVKAVELPRNAGRGDNVRDEKNFIYGGVGGFAGMGG